MATYILILFMYGHVDVQYIHYGNVVCNRVGQVAVQERVAYNYKCVKF